MTKKHKNSINLQFLNTFVDYHYCKCAQRNNIYKRSPATESISIETSLPNGMKRLVHHTGVSRKKPD